MEDRYGAFTRSKEIFIKTMDAAQRLSKGGSEEIRDEALLLLEFVKEYYMNYPLKGQTPTVTNSLFDEVEFYGLQEKTIKNYHRNAIPRRRSVSHSGTELSSYEKLAKEEQTVSPIHRVPSIEEIENGKLSNDSGSGRLYEMLKKSSPLVMQYITGSTSLLEKEEKMKRVETVGNMTAGEIKEVEEFALWKSKTVHLGLGTEAIVSIIQSPHLTSRIMIRDLTGRHAWLITEHRVLDYNCLDSIDYNDKAAVCKNVLNTKGDKKLKEIITENKSPIEQKKECEKEIAQKLEADIKSVLPLDPVKLEEEIKKIQKTDTLTRILSVLSKNCTDIKLVFLYEF